jgi:hypothetical protein
MQVRVETVVRQNSILNAEAVRGVVFQGCVP